MPPSALERRSIRLLGNAVSTQHHLKLDNWTQHAWCLYPRDCGRGYGLLNCYFDEEPRGPAPSLPRSDRPNQLGLSFELVVVDNNSTDSTRAAVEHFARAALFPVTYVFERQPGLSFARNAGVAGSRGSIIVFTDDDCYPREDLLDQVDAAFRDPGRSGS